MLQTGFDYTDIVMPRTTGETLPKIKIRKTDAILFTQIITKLWNRWLANYIRFNSSVAVNTIIVACETRLAIETECLAPGKRSVFATHRPDRHFPRGQDRGYGPDLRYYLSACIRFPNVSDRSPPEGSRPWSERPST